MTEQTLVLIKPDAVAAGHAAAILARYQETGLKVTRLEERTADATLADAHYAEHVGREYYPALREFITSGPLLAAVIEGDDAIERVRALQGATNPAEAEAGTIRADFGESVRRNAVDASDSAESAAREIAVWFGDDGAATVDTMKFAVTLAADSETLVGLGRAPRIAVATVTDGQVTDWKVTAVRWDIAHDQGAEGTHHARIVRFMRENEVDAVLAAHVGQGMVNTLTKMGLPILPASQPDARAALEDVLAEHR